MATEYKEKECLVFPGGYVMCRYDICNECHDVRCCLACPYGCTSKCPIAKERSK